MIRQLAGYGVVGFVQLGMEWFLFVAATLLATPVPLANVLARIAGASVGFWLNGRYTFAKEGGTLNLRSLLRFCASWAVLTAVGTLAVSNLEQVGGLSLAWCGKPIVDLMLAAVGFFASKYWVYR